MSALTSLPSPSRAPAGRSRKFCACDSRRVQILHVSARRSAVERMSAVSHREPPNEVDGERDARGDTPSDGVGALVGQQGTEHGQCQPQ